MLAVTAAQEQLLLLLNSVEVKDHVNSLKKVHFLATYCIPLDLVSLNDSCYVHRLLDAVTAIANE